MADKLPENRFGMFIHFGIYAATELHEQALARYDIPREEYEALAKTFDPKNFDPEAWVLLAKNAGMQYICFTAKHHDGFCMWDTKYTDYNIMNTPYGKDILAMLSAACEKHGMRLSIYYSNPDWHHEWGYNPLSSHQFASLDKTKVDTAKYREYVKGQITELLSNYGKIYTLFWDIPPKYEDKSINALVRRLQPGIYINDRGYDEGDFSTPEREFVAIGGKRFSRMTEACNSVGANAWGYRREEDFYTFRHIASAIDRIMAMGGSYLLNVGPRPDGVIDPSSSLRIARVGDFYNRVKEGLEGVSEDAAPYTVARDPFIATKRKSSTYFHFYNGLSADAVVIADYPARPVRVVLLNTGDDLPFTEEPVPGIRSVDGVPEKISLHIRKIPADDLPAEPIVLRVDWQN